MLGPEWSLHPQLAADATWSAISPCRDFWRSMQRIIRGLFWCRDASAPPSLPTSAATRFR